MTKSETQFRIWCKKKYPNGYIKKVPDFKVGGHSPGLPDYLIIDVGRTIWYEVKKIKGKTINLENHFTSAQKIEFYKMIMSGAEIFIYIFYKGGTKIINYFELYLSKKIKLVL